MRKLITMTNIVTAAVMAAGLAVVPASAETIPFPNQEVVRPSDIRPVADAASGDPGWYRTTVGTATAEPTDAKPYNQQGSLEFNLEGTGSYAEIGLYNRLAAHRLSDLGENGLSYATWQTTDDPQAVALQVNVDLDVTDSFTSWQGRLVFEPYLGNVDTMGRSITKDTWQTWIASKSDANWWMTWSSAATTHYGMANPCPQSDPCTTAEVVNIFPDAGFSDATGNALVLKAGSGWDSFVGYADVPYVGDTTNTYWDFEPAAIPAPTNKDQCKKNGWMSMTSSEGFAFKNQGECVSSIQSQKP